MISGDNKIKRIIRSLSGTVDFIVLALLIAAIIFALYALWDSHQVFAAADSTRYEQYKPTADDTISFDELREMNPDVIGWLTVYDTKIDYPVVNSKNSNDDYLSRNPLGEIEASGSLFNDYRNSKNFADFNTIIFGHHMAERAMFGDIDLFLEKDFFDSHEYGNLFFRGYDHGIQIFSIMIIDAHEQTIYSVPATTAEAKQDYLDYIQSHTKYGRDVKVTTEDQIVLLSTCSEDITNGRYVLAAKILDRPVKNPFPEEETEHNRANIDVFDLFDQWLMLPAWQWIFVLLFLILIVFALWRLEHQRYSKVRARRLRVDVKVPEQKKRKSDEYEPGETE